MTWRCRDFAFALERTLTVGIVNVTPDSFSDGGRYFRPEEAIRRVKNCFREGADLVDLGGESTRPGATPLAWEEEWARLSPVLAGLKEAHLPLSVDTYHPETADRALAAGASVINCVSFEDAPAMAARARATGAGLIVPYRLPPDPAVAPPPLPLEGEQVMIDPMIGFGTTREEDLALLGSIRRLAARAPVLVGVSRKRLIKRMTGVEGGVGRNTGGSLAAAVWCALAGASAVRVHDVKETVEALRVTRVLAGCARAARGEAQA